MLVISPNKACVTEIIKIAGHGFEPSTSLTVHATLFCASERLDMHSCAHVTASADGSFDLRTTESKGGSYIGVDVMGLFWTMEKRHGSSYSSIQITNGFTQLEYKFDVYNGHIDNFDSKKADNLCSANCVRYYGDKRNMVRENVHVRDVRGTLFCPVKGEGPFPAIVTMYGNVRNKHVVEDAAALLANHGFVTLALAFYGVESLPKSYASQPGRVEYFEEATEFLSRHPKVDANAVGAFGSSKGGDIALAMMSHLPNIKAVCTFNGAIASIGTSTTYRGKVTPMLTIDPGKMSSHAEGVYNVREVLVDPRDEPESIHKFERSNADLLMIVGLDDWNWKSELMADIAEDRMKAVGKKNYKISKHMDMGHTLVAPFTPGLCIGAHALAPNRAKVYFGGLNNKRNHTYAIRDAWIEIFTFFNKSLKKKSVGLIDSLL